jgi:hypothetical protein
MFRTFALLIAIAGAGFAAGCHEDHDDHDRDHHARWENNRREEVIVVPARGTTIERDHYYHDRD